MRDSIVRPRLRIAVALVRRADGRTLLVRKRGTIAFMQPGGKIEPGEVPVDALLRELREELGLVVPAARLGPLGSAVAEAANEPGWQVEATLFRLDGVERVHPASEIEEVAWVDPRDPGPLVLAPLTRDHVLPLAAASETGR